jgi:hypothetical protein
MRSARDWPRTSAPTTAVALPHSPPLPPTDSFQTQPPVGSSCGLITRPWTRSTRNAIRAPHVWRSVPRPQQEHTAQPGGEPAADQDRRPPTCRCWPRWPTRTSSGGDRVAMPNRTPSSVGMATVCARANARIPRMHDVPVAVAAARRTGVIRTVRRGIKSLGYGGCPLCTMVSPCSPEVFLAY